MCQALVQFLVSKEKRLYFFLKIIVLISSNLKTALFIFKFLMRSRHVTQSYLELLGSS
jgi:hypothetical protein